VISVLGAGLVAERGATLGRPVTVAVVLAAGFAASLAFLSLPPAVKDAASLGVAGVVGVLAGLLVPDLGLANALLFCLLAGSFGLIARRIAAGDPLPARVTAPVAAGVSVPAGRAGARRARRQALRSARRDSEASMLVGASLPVLVAGPWTYVLGRLLVG